MPLKINHGLDFNSANALYFMSGLYLNVHKCLEQRLYAEYRNLLDHGKEEQELSTSRILWYYTSNQRRTKEGPNHFLLFFMGYSDYRRSQILQKQLIIHISHFINCLLLSRIVRVLMPIKTLNRRKAHRKGASSSQVRHSNINTHLF